MKTEYPELYKDLLELQEKNTKLLAEADQIILEIENIPQKNFEEHNKINKTKTKFMRAAYSLTNKMLAFNKKLIEVYS